MKQYLIAILSFFFCFTLSAQQNGRISGNVVDGNTGEPFPYVAVAIYEETPDSLPVKGIFSDEGGNFLLENIPDGSYTLQFSFVGYQHHTIKITLQPGNRNVQLKNIPLKEDAKVLDEIEVTGQVTQMKFDIDKKIFMVNQSALSAGAGTDEILKNIPSVNVDNDGNISLRNNESVQVWINGKPSGLTVENRGQILEQLPAESVESIEIITNPSAKYNPEGSAGIINIVLKKNRKAGYFGSVSAGVHYPWGMNAGANLNYSNKKIDTYINLSYRNRTQERGGFRNRASFGENVDTTYLNQENTTTTSNEAMFLRSGIDYHIDDKNTIGLSGFGMLGNRNSNTHYDYTSLNNLREITQIYTQETSSDRNNTGYNLNLDYKHDFAKKGHEFTAYTGFARFNSDSYSGYEFDRTGKNSFRQEEARRQSDEYVLQADYVLPLQKAGKLEAGYKSDFSIESSFMTGNIENESGLPLNYSYFDDFTYEQQIHSLYAIYKNKSGTLGYQFGLRGEATINNWENETDNGNASYFNLFPSLSLSNAFDETNEVQLSVARRINRPGWRRVNPFVDRSDPTDISYGNPGLKPEYAWAYELNYIKTWPQHTLSSSAYLRRTNNVVQAISIFSQPEAEQAYMETTYENITSSQNAGFEFTLKNKFFSFLEVTSMINLYYYQMDGVKEYDIKETEDFSWNTKIIGNILFRKGFSGQITGSYKAPVLQAQGKKEADYSIDIGLKKEFFDKLTTTFSVRDVLNSRKNRSETFGDNFFQISERYTQGPNMRLTISYSFGNMKPKNTAKKTKISTDMDDDM